MTQRTAPGARLPLLRISSAAQTSLIEGARDGGRVTGLTHNFYRYPARFSPQLVRAAIEVFTKRGDLVLDPFVGGGTTLVEAMALGRPAMGVDISSLATFVSAVKTTLYKEQELTRLTNWAVVAAESIDLRRPVEDHGFDSAVRHLDGAGTWRLRKAVAQGIESARALRSHRLERFGRCAVLKTAQWALDGRRTLPTVAAFRDELARNVPIMIGAAREFGEKVHMSGLSTEALCINGKTSELLSRGIANGIKPRLVLTSPPYPGVHVLYHRWQVDGRKETSAPFWIADTRDGAGAAYYTMGARNTRELHTYFSNLRESLGALVKVCDHGTIVMQVVAFSQPEWQLPRYLSVADDVGMEECLLGELRGVEDGRLWRDVPNRKWHADQQGHTSGSREVVLFHRTKRAT